MKNKIQIFEKQPIRAVWDEENEKWWFSVVDIVAVLTESIDPAAYWRKLKQRLKEEGNETVTNCHGFKMLAHDGKMRLTIFAFFAFSTLRLCVKINNMNNVG
ncbi:MAG: hypothetical protein FWH18_08625 [Marinilabiliaceae bacterium]|nr:hypothetical protein [Marinilabiliaceae bacterium]